MHLAISRGGALCWPSFQPGMNPTTTGAQRVMTSIRSVTLAFFDRWLMESGDRPYDGLVAPADIYINIYPLGDLKPIPGHRGTALPQPTGHANAFGTV